MAYTARPLEERMTLIWHGLLTSQVSKIGPQRAVMMGQRAAPDRAEIEQRARTCARLFLNGCKRAG